MANLFKARFATTAPKALDLLETRQVKAVDWDFNSPTFGMRIVEFPQTVIGRQLGVWLNAREPVTSRAIIQ